MRGIRKDLYIGLKKDKFKFYFLYFYFVYYINK